MHRLFFFSLILVGLALEACEKPEVVPSCIQYMLPHDGEFTAAANDFVADPIPPRDIVAVYRFEDGKDVYYEVELGCCDQFTELYNQDCELVCFPRGGITGGGAGDCPSWVDELGEGVLIWEKK